MKPNECMIVRDLLPLYADDCCSKDSKKFIENHLVCCESCQKSIEQMNSIISTPETIPTKADNAQTLSKGLRLIRKIILIFLAVVLIITVTGVAAIYHFAPSGGVKIDNLDEIAIADAFLQEMKLGNLDDAFSYFDLERKKKEWLTTRPDVITEDMLVNFEEDGLAKFKECAAPFVEAGMTEYELIRADRYSSSHFHLNYRIVVGGKTYELQLSVFDGKIDSISGGNGYIPDPDVVTQMCRWSWYVFVDYTE